MLTISEDVNKTLTYYQMCRANSSYNKDARHDIKHKDNVDVNRMKPIM